MFRVTTLNLTPDLKAAVPDLGPRSVGPVDAPALLGMLEAFRAIDPVQNHDAAPEFIIETDDRKSLVRTRNARLFLYDARDAGGPCLELDPAGVLRELSAAAAAPTEAAPTPESAPSRPHRILAVTLLIAAAALDAYALRSVSRTPSVEPKLPVQFVTDAREVTAQQLSAQGRYATGDEPGDRVIVVQADGRVRFLRVVASGEKLESQDSYRIGRIDGKACLVTTASGVIEVGNIDTLSYYRDVYRRK